MPWEHYRFAENKGKKAERARRLAKSGALIRTSYHCCLNTVPLPSYHAFPSFIPCLDFASLAINYLALLDGKKPRSLLPSKVSLSLSLSPLIYFLVLACGFAFFIIIIRNSGFVVGWYARAYINTRLALCSLARQSWWNFNLVSVFQVKKQWRVWT